MKRLISALVIICSVMCGDVLFVLSPVSVAQCEENVVQDDQEWAFEVPAHGESKAYERPAKAEYFWWDTDDSVQVELTFEDGTKLNTGSSEEFRKKIVSVKFINPGEKAFPVKLWARF